jgi:hypothetical protein
VGKWFLATCFGGSAARRTFHIDRPHRTCLLERLSLIFDPGRPL